MLKIREQFEINKRNHNNCNFINVQVDIDEAANVFLNKCVKL